MSEDTDLKELKTQLNRVRRRMNFYGEKIEKERGKVDEEVIQKYEKEVNEAKITESTTLREIEEKCGDVSSRINPNTKTIEGAGLFSKEENNSLGTLSFPLQSVNHTIEVVNSVACIRTTQKFVNISEKPVEMIYRYPLLFSSSPHKVSVIITDPVTKKEWSFEAICEEKVKASEEYDDSIAEGNTAVLMTKGDDDHISMNLGNIKPKFEIQVISIILQEMSMEIIEEEQQQLLRMKITIPAIHNKKDDGIAQRAKNNLPQKIQSVEGSMTQLMGKVKSISCPTHPQECFDFKIYSTDSDDDDNKIDFRTKSKLGLDKEVTFHVELTSPQFMTSQIEKCEEKNESTICVSINPIFDVVEKEEGEEDESIPMEHIIILDRSGSMSSRNRMTYAIQALQLFIKSLDIDSEPLVNLIGFGSRMEKLYDTSRVLDEETFPHILKHITESRPNLGGTAMRIPFQYVIDELPEAKDFIRVVYLLTDGAAARPEIVTELVKANCKKLQIYSFGIGRSINPSFLTNLSRMTNGRAVFLQQTDQIRPLVIEQLKFATQGSKCFFHPQVSLVGSPNTKVEWTTPFPKVLFPLRRINLYGWINNNNNNNNNMKESEGEEEDGEEGEVQVKEVVLKYKRQKNSDKFEEVRTPLVRTKKLEEGSKSSVDTMFFPVNPLGTFAGMNLVEYLESQNLKNRSDENEKKILELSLKYHFLSSQTSFIGVKVNNNDGEVQISDNMETVEVPTVPYIPGGDVEYTVKKLTAEDYERKRCEALEKEKQMKMRDEKRKMIERERQERLLELKKKRESERECRKQRLLTKKKEVLNSIRMKPKSSSSSSDYRSFRMYSSLQGSSSEDEMFMNIVNKQQFFGNWEPEIMDDLKISNLVKEELKKLMMGSTRDEQNNELGYWTTAVIIALLNIKFKEKEKEWSLIVKKSKKYLEKKKKSDWIVKAELFVQNLSIPGLK